MRQPLIGILLLILPGPLSGNRQIDDAKNKLREFKNTLADTLGDRKDRAFVILRDFDARIDKIKPDERIDYATKLTSIADSAVKAAQAINSGDSAASIQAMLSLAGTVGGAFAGPAAPLVSGVFALLGTLIGLLEDTPSVGTMMRDMIEKEFYEDSHRDMVDEYYGAMRVLDDLQRVLTAALTKKESYTERDIMYLSSQISTTTASRVLGMIRSNIERHSKDADPNRGADFLRRYLKLYVQLVTINKVVMSMANEVFERADGADVAKIAVAEFLEGSEASDRIWLKTLEGRGNETISTKSLRRMVLLYLDMRDETDLVNYLSGQDVNILWQLHKFQGSSHGRCMKLSQCSATGSCKDGFIGPGERNALLRSEYVEGTAAKFAHRTAGDHYVKLFSPDKGDVTLCQGSFHGMRLKEFLLAFDLTDLGHEYKSCEQNPAVFNAFVKPDDETAFRLRAFDIGLMTSQNADGYIVNGLSRSEINDNINWHWWVTASNC